MQVLNRKSRNTNMDMERRNFSSKNLLTLTLCLFLQASLFVPPAALASEDSHERHHHVELEIARDKEAYVQTQFGDKAEIDWGHSTASDGFKTGYLRLTPKNFDKTNGKTLLMLHGFSKDGTYWLDYVKAIDAIEMGYQVILPDLMVRGRTLDLNFPLNENGDWKPSDEVKKKFTDVTGTREADYIHQLLKNLAPSQNYFKGGLGLLTHSRGTLVGAKLLTKLGNENLDIQQTHGNTRSLPWNIFSYLNLNGFVSYTTASFLTLKNVEFSPKNSTQKNKPDQMSITERETRNYIMSALEMLNLEYEIQLLRNQTVDENKDPQELENMLEAAKKLESKLGAIKQSFLPAMEGVAESSFVDYVMTTIGQMLKDVYPENKNLNGLIKREQDAMRAMMEGLRHLVRVNVNSSGRQTYLSKMKMFPESVIGDFILFNHKGYPGLPKNIYNISGRRDTIVPPHISQHIQMSTGLKSDYSSRVTTIPMDISHYGPEESELRAFTKKTLSAYSRQPIERLTITASDYEGKKGKNMSVATKLKRKNFRNFESASQALAIEMHGLKENKCSGFYNSKLNTKVQQ
ncbi:MAG: hypothetical protein JNL11_09475 [Bdellovibrionaceae bacterium]|nr:hypothetical protein [Pseudobdellovibrionaceae bacterium]